MSHTADVQIHGIDVPLLQEQRNHLLAVLKHQVDPNEDYLDGVLNLLDTILNSASGFPRR